MLSKEEEVIAARTRGVVINAHRNNEDSVTEGAAVDSPAGKSEVSLILRNKHGGQCHSQLPKAYCVGMGAVVQLGGGCYVFWLGLK